MIFTLSYLPQKRFVLSANVLCGYLIAFATFRSEMPSGWSFQIVRTFSVSSAKSSFNLAQRYSSRSQSAANFSGRALGSGTKSMRVAFVAPSSLRMGASKDSVGEM